MWRAEDTAAGVFFKPMCNVAPDSRQVLSLFNQECLHAHAFSYREVIDEKQCLDLMGGVLFSFLDAFPLGGAP